MSADSDRGLALIFGIIGALLIVVDGLLKVVGGAYYLALGRGPRALGVWESAVLFLVVGFLMGFFALVGRAGSGDRAVTSGAVLVVLVVAGWLVLGLTSGVLALLGSLLVLVSGVLYLLAGR